MQQAIPCTPVLSLLFEARYSKNTPSREEVRNEEQHKATTELFSQPSHDTV